MHILEIKEVADSKLIYDFKVKEKVVFLSTEKILTNKWLNLENWYWIYKKVTEISLDYTSDKIKLNKEFEVLCTLPGSISIKVKLIPICKTIKHILDIMNYEFGHYFDVTIEYKDEILERELKKFTSLENDKFADLSSVKPKNEYSPTPIIDTEVLVYTPNTRSASKNVDNKLSYTPTSKRGHSKNDHNEYVPKGVDKIVGISYTPTKISIDSKNDILTAPIVVSSSTSTDDQTTDANNEESVKKKGRCHRNGKRINYAEPFVEEMPKRKKHKDKKNKFAELFDDESDTSDKESSQGSSNKVHVINKSPSKRSKSSSSSTTASTSKSTRKINKILDQKVDQAIKRVTPCLDPNIGSKLNVVLDASFPIRDINCFNMTKEEIKKSFIIVKPRLDKVIDDFYNNKIIKLKKACDDPYLVHELFTSEQLEFMYSYLQDHYLSDDESGATFCDFMTNHLLPTWALSLYSNTHNIPIHDVLNISA